MNEQKKVKDALIEMRTCASARDQTGDKLLAVYIGAWADELDQLRQRVAEVEAELVSTRDDRETYAIENDELRAKLALAEQDARRYRWLRDNCLTNECLDSSVDAAIASQGKK